MGGCVKMPVAFSPTKRPSGTLDRVPTRVVRRSRRCLKREEVERKWNPQPVKAETGEEVVECMQTYFSRPRSLQRNCQGNHVGRLLGLLEKKRAAERPFAYPWLLLDVTGLCPSQWSSLQTLYPAAAQVSRQRLLPTKIPEQSRLCRGNVWVAATFLESNLAVAIEIQNACAFWPGRHRLGSVGDRSKCWRWKDILCKAVYHLKL